MIAIVDMGIGNLLSVQSGFERAGSPTVTFSRAAEWDAWQASEDAALTGIVLPGVGAFGDAMFQLRASGLLQVIRGIVKSGRPFLGICVGMQLLFALSEEHGTHMGLGYLPGTVVRFKGPAKVPHMGWNDFTEVKSHSLTAGIQRGDFVYYVHSYYASMLDGDCIVAATTYSGVTVPAIVAQGSLYGTQFHPEKSGAVGEQVLRNFVAVCEQWRLAKGEIVHEPV